MHYIIVVFAAKYSQQTPVKTPTAEQIGCTHHAGVIDTDILH